jgi:flagellar biosynthesis/type III secretory pathway protein FliH
MKPIPIAQYLNQFGKATPTQIDSLRRESVLLRPRILSTPADIDARIEEALERGRREGLAAGRAETAAVLAMDGSVRDERENARRLAWQGDEYAQFAEKIEGAMAAIEDRLAQAVARILKPFLIEERVKRVTEALSENLSRILSKDSPTLLKITGPEALLSVLRDKMSSHSVAVEYCSADGVDVTVEANQTIIQSQLQAWIDHIETIGE